MADSTLLKEAADRGEHWVSVQDRGSRPQRDLICSGCAKVIEPSAAFETRRKARPDKENDGHVGRADSDDLFCEDCRSTLLGPACRACGEPTARKDAIVALDSYYHRDHFACSEVGCGKLIAGAYFVHDGAAYCRDHFLERAAERCARCGDPVDGGLRALGQAWHEGCLQCEFTGEALGTGPDAPTAYLLDGVPLAEKARAQTAPPCGVCGEPAVEDRIAVGGVLYHRECFRCAHCKEAIGERRFVWFDDAPYLDGCYQKVFGASADRETRELMKGETRRYACLVPLQSSLGPKGLAAFYAKHSELLPEVKRQMREAGVTALQTFLFQPPMVTKPSLALTFAMPAALDAKEEFVELLQQDRVGQEWMQLLTSSHDAAAAKGNAWYTTIAPEIQGATAVQ